MHRLRLVVTNGIRRNKQAGSTFFFKVSSYVIICFINESAANNEHVLVTLRRVEIRSGHA